VKQKQSHRNLTVHMRDRQTTAHNQLWPAIQFCNMGVSSHVRTVYKLPCAPMAELNNYNGLNYKN
jgi:hypothetical protein